MRKIQIEELFLCLTDKDLLNKNLIKNGKLSLKNVENAVTTIQKFFRMFFCRKNYLDENSYKKKIILIQIFYRSLKFKHYMRTVVQQKYSNDYDKWKSIMSHFKENWKNIKNNPRYEIHINSISNDSKINETIEHYSEKENLQLDRITRLADPNLNIIFISPYDISDDVLAYYFALLSSFNIENARERFHLIVPVNNFFIKKSAKYLPKSFCLSKLLYLSAKDIRKIKNITDGVYTYVIPGTVRIILIF